MKREKIINMLFSLKDEKYKDFQAPLIPNIEKKTIIGVRTPDLKILVKSIKNDEDTKDFLNILPHEYFDEYQIHAFLINEIKDFSECIKYTESFLPFTDNWATCDSLNPKVFKKEKQNLIPYIFKWIKDDHTYTVRFSIKMLMAHFLDSDFSDEYPQMVSTLRSDEYYINMMISWYFATALAKQYNFVISYIENKVLPLWVHNKTIQKAIESRRITESQKQYLRSLKIKNS